MMQLTDESSAARQEPNLKIDAHTMRQDSIDCPSASVVDNKHDARSPPMSPLSSTYSPSLSSDGLESAMPSPPTEPFKRRLSELPNVPWALQLPSSPRQHLHRRPISTSFGAATPISFAPSASTSPSSSSSSSPNSEFETGESFPFFEPYLPSAPKGEFQKEQKEEEKGRRSPVDDVSPSSPDISPLSLPVRQFPFACCSRAPSPPPSPSPGASRSVPLLLDASSVVPIANSSTGEHEEAAIPSGSGSGSGLSGRDSSPSPNGNKNNSPFTRSLRFRDPQRSVHQRERVRGGEGEPSRVRSPRPPRPPRWTRSRRWREEEAEFTYVCAKLPYEAGMKPGVYVEYEYGHERGEGEEEDAVVGGKRRGGEMGGASASTAAVCPDVVEGEKGGRGVWGLGKLGRALSVTDRMKGSKKSSGGESRSRETRASVVDGLNKRARRVSSIFSTFARGEDRDRAELAFGTQSCF